jgi:hypothetical protein
MGGMEEIEMKKSIGIFGILLIAFASTAAAGQNPPTTLSAKLAYQEGLFFQRTIGNLEKALNSYDRALQAATEVEDSGLLESILLRRAECFKLLGRENQQQTEIAALQKETRAATARLGSARFFPPESDMIVQVDLAALLSAPLFERLKMEAEINQEELKQAIQILGFDPLKDLHKLTVGVTISDNYNLPAEHWLIHLEGRLTGFRPDRLIESSKQLSPGVLPRTKKIYGADVLVFKLPLPDEEVKVMTVGVAFLGKQGILAGELKGLESALAARAGKAPGLSANPKLARLTGQVPENSTFWLVGVPTRIVEKLQKMGPNMIPSLPNNLPEVAGLMLSGRVGKDLEATGVAFTEDLHSARLLGDIFKGLLALAQLVPLEDEPLVKKLLSSLKVETKDREVKVSITLPAELIGLDESRPKEAKRKSAGMGSLSINTNPWSVVFIDGKKAGNTPLQRIKLKAGRHEINLVNQAEGIRETLKIVIEADKDTKIMKMFKKK